MDSIFKLGILFSVVDSVTSPAFRMGKSMEKLKGKAAALGPAFDKFKTYGLRVATAGALVLHMLSGAVKRKNLEGIPNRKISCMYLSSINARSLGAQ